MGLGAYAAMFAAALAIVLVGSAAGPVEHAAACVITAPANIAKSNDPNQAGAVATYGAPSTSGADCGTITCSPASGSFFPVGTTPVTCSSGGDPGSRGTFQVTINDTQSPLIAAMLNVTAVTEPGQKAALATFTPPKATDNAPGVQVSCTHPTTALYPVGTTKVFCTARDVAGNTATTGFSVIVTATPALVTPTPIAPAVTASAPKLFFAQVRNGRLTYVLSTAAAVKIDLARCLDAKCSKSKAATTLAQTAAEGTNRMKLPARAGGKALPAGAYKVTLVATAGSQVSAPLVARYRVK
jgi:hypothetical protein